MYNKDHFPEENIQQPENPNLYTHYVVTYNVHHVVQLQ